MDASRSIRTGGWSHWYWLFVAEFAISLWPPFYNRIEPTGSAFRSSTGTSCSAS